MTWRHRFIRIVPGDFNGIFGLDIRDDIFSFTHDLLELSGDRGADALFFYAACDSDDLIPVRDADALTGSGGQCFRVFFCKASKLPDRGSTFFNIISPSRSVKISSGSLSRIRSVRRISFGMTTRPRSSILLTIPVAFIKIPPFIVRSVSGNSICK